MKILSLSEALSVLGGTEHPWDSDVVIIVDKNSEHPWDSDVTKEDTANLS